MTARLARGAAVLAAAGFVSACAAKPAPPEPPKGSPARIVSATVLTNGCASLGAVNARLAEDAMHRLVEGCSAVPGGAMQFTATLQPGGRIELAQGPGAPDVVPSCALKNELRHKVYLQKPCNLEVRLEETTINLPLATPIADAAADAARDR